MVVSSGGCHSSPTPIGDANLGPRPISPSQIWPMVRSSDSAGRLSSSTGFPRGEVPLFNQFRPVHALRDLPCMSPDLMVPILVRDLGHRRQGLEIPGRPSIASRKQANPRAGPPVLEVREGRGFIGLASRAPVVADPTRGPAPD